jgi:hypothetical protein
MKEEWTQDGHVPRHLSIGSGGGKGSAKVNQSVDHHGFIQRNHSGLNPF